MKDWKKHLHRIEELKRALEQVLSGLDLEYDLLLPGEGDFDPSLSLPYVRLRYYADENHTYERKIELFEYYLESPVEETVKLIKDMAEEFLMEIDQSQYGGG